MSSRSTSAIIARAVRGHHLLKINGYSQTKVVTNRSYIQSCTFDVGGHSWRIKYYPSGRSSSYPNWISIYIKLVSVSKGMPVEPQVITAHGSLSLLDRAGNVSWCSYIFNRRFTTTEEGWGLDTFMYRDYLNDFLKDDCFTLRCDITVTELRTEETDDGDFAHLLWNKERADVSFDVRGETFTAHRWVLAARSPILKAATELFGAPEREKKKAMAKVRIDDMEAKVFKALLHYIYIDALPEMDKDDEAATAMAHRLLEAADRYKMDRLKLICEDMLCKRVSTSTVITTLMLAEQHHCERLKAACIEFLVSPEKMKAALEARAKVA